MKDYSESIEVHESASHGSASKDLLAPDLTMVLLTWVTFFVLLGILYKFAWKKILGGLEQREKIIQQSLDDARKAKEEMERIDQTRKEILDDANQQAKSNIERSRKAATEAAKVIEHKAKDEVQILLGNANHEIKARKDKAHMELREESVDVAVNLASKIIDQKLNATEHKKLIDTFIKEFKPEDYDRT